MDNTGSCNNNMALLYRTHFNMALLLLLDRKQYNMALLLLLDRKQYNMALLDRTHFMFHSLTGFLEPATLESLQRHQPHKTMVEM